MTGRQDWTPQPKVAATGVTGAATVVLLWALGQFGVTMPLEVAAAVTWLLSAGAGYLWPDRRPPA